MVNRWSILATDQDLKQCLDCGDTICTKCNEHIHNCECPRENGKDYLEFKIINGLKYARSIDHGAND